MSALSLELFRRQLEIAMGKRPRRPLTALEKMQLEEKSEQDQAREFWRAFREEEWDS